MRTADGTGSGYASFASPRLADIDAAALAERSATKAESSAKPRDLPPGRYTVILEPAAVADLLGCPDLLAQRPRRRRGTQLPLEARRRQSPGREALRRQRDPCAPIHSTPAIPGMPWAAGGRGSGGGRRRRRRRWAAGPHGPPGSRTASSRRSPSTATGRPRPRSSPSRSPAA